MVVVGVVIGGALGATARYAIATRFASRKGVFPTGTLVANVAGSLLLGLTLGLVSSGHLPESTLVWAGAGFCGGMTTFSTFAFETLQLAGQSYVRDAWRTVGLSIVLSVGAAWLGLLIGGGQP